jgi:flagellar biosynthesis/type III secretory pathway chaperone
MTTPAVRDHQSPLEIALLDVRATLADLLIAADEQHAAVVARDRDRLESVTRQQERLSARLAHAEAKRLQLTGGAPMSAIVETQPTQIRTLSDSIAALVRELKHKEAQTASLLQQSIELTTDTLNFLQRLVSPAAPAYGARGVAAARGQTSLMVDSRA